MIIDAIIDPIIEPIIDPFDSYGELTSTLMTFDTTKAGSAATNLVLPFVNGGTYACTVSWGDGTSNYITAWNDAALTHTYAASGTYNVEIIGTCNGLRFNNGGDKLKLMIIKRWGTNFRLGNANGYFYGCANLTITATDVLNLTGTTTLSYVFYGCSSIITIPSLNSWNTASVTDMSFMFSSCSNFNQSVSFNTASVTTMRDMFYVCSKFNQSISLNTSAVTTMRNMFYQCSIFNQSVAGLNTSKVTNMNSMFYQCFAFNQSVAGFDTSKVTDMSYMFIGCSVFNQDLSAWIITALTTATGMFQAITLSTANYDALLIGWAAQVVIASVSFHGGSSKYSAGAAAAARAVLTGAPNLWIIVDGGAA